MLSLAHAVARPPIAFISQAWFSWRGMDKNSGLIRALLEEGLAHQRAGRLEEALQRYGRVLTAGPGNFPAWHFSGLARLRQGAFVQAAPLLAAALSVNPADADTLDF